MPSISPSSFTIPAPPVSGLVGVSVAIDAYVARPDDSGTAVKLRAALRLAAETISGMSASEVASEKSGSARELVATVMGCGIHDAPVTAEDLALARTFAARGGAGLLAAMLLVPSWQWPDAPALAQVPAALIGDYTAWLIAPPQGFVACGQADKFSACYLERLEDILRFARARPDGNVRRLALATYIQRGNCIPLYFCSDSLRRHYELRAQILQSAAVRPAVHLAPRARKGRRLRVGFINRHFGPQTETYTTLPTFEQLDPARFEVLLFTHHAAGTVLEQYAWRYAAAVTVLPADPGAQVDLLRAADLDIAVIGTNVTAVFNEVVRLALHRFAPLQVVNNSSCTTTGLPEIDLYVSGTLTEAPDAPAHFSERLGLVAGPAHAFNYEADRQQPTGSWSRAALGLPEDAVVFVTAANYFKIIPEMRETWARLLAAVPGSRLLLHPFNPNWSSSYPIKRFTAELDRVFAAHGVAPDRLVVSSVKFPSRTEVKSLLAVGDIYLDTFPFGGVNSLVDPLELGMPVAVWEGGVFRARMGGALLRSLGLGELIATDQAGYLALATRLASDAEARAALKVRIADAMGRTPVFLDSLAASDAFGALLETAYDELLAVGRTEFRRRRTPVMVARPADSMARVNEGWVRFEAGATAAAGDIAREVIGADPANPAARHLLGAVLLRAGNALRAVDYFVGAVQHAAENAQLWHDLALALCKSGQHDQALPALETSLRLAPERVEGWLLLAELALNAGNRDLLDHALGVAAQLAPNDARVNELRQRASLPPVPSLARSPSAKHILFYTDDPDRGGVAHYNHSILLALVRAGYRVTCVQTESDSDLVREQQIAGVCHCWIGYDTGREFGRTVTDEVTARQIFEGDRPDLVIFSDCCPVSNLAAREVALRLEIPFVVVVGFVGAYLAKNFAAQLPALARHYAAAKAVVAVSQENLDLLREHFGLSPDRGQVIHYGRPEHFFKPRDESVRARLRASLGVPAEAVVCFTAARLTGVKRHDLQLEAITQLVAGRTGSDLHFVWAGDGDQRAVLEKAVQHRGLSRCVHLLGQRADVGDWYDAADIFVLTSQLEGMPLAIMEAMAKGLPVVATAVSGIPEELSDTGKLLPDPTADPRGVVRGLTGTISNWAANPSARHSVGKRGRERAEQMFREERMLEQTLHLVAEACECLTTTPPSDCAPQSLLLSQS